MREPLPDGGDSDGRLPGGDPLRSTTPRSAPPLWLGEGLPYVNTGDLSGKLITIEGTDSSGRSTQMKGLREWLEVQGYGVVETGWTRSELMSEAINVAKAGHQLNRVTFTLMYAIDFADRLENQIIPALESGFVVLADRYLYTALARARVRGIDEEWVRALYGFAIQPDLVLYLKVDAETLIRRVLQGDGIEYWEAGMDLNLGEDPYDSFMAYQSRLLDVFDELSGEFGFRIVDGNRSIYEIQQDLRREIREFLDLEDTQGGVLEIEEFTRGPATGWSR
ncbi:MAG: dTMP kinase [Gemmatimonadetes bacterium]|nr:dTMP kinase [Gemmatimonadota bacterium]